MKKDKKTKESLNQAQVLGDNCPFPQQENFTVSFLLQILNGIEDPIFVKDRQHRLVLMNKAFATLIGREPAEVIGKSDYDLFPQSEADVFWEKDELVFTTGITNENEEFFTDAQGVTRFISTKKSLFADDTGNQFLIGTIRDTTQTKLIEAELENRATQRTQALQAEITERQQKEAKLRASEQRLALLIQQTPVGVVEWNTKFEIQEWNPAAEKIFGYSRSEVLGCHFAFLVPEIAKEHVVKVMDTLLYSQGEIVSVNENVTKDNRTIICEWYNNPLIADNGEVISIAAMVLDITERKQAEQNLVLYKQAVESSSDAIAIADAEGNHIYQNSAFCKLYECETVEDFIKLGGVHAVITNSEVAQQMWQTILGGKPWMGEVEQQSAHGRIIQTFLRAYPLKDSTGQNIGLVGVITDITGHKQSEELLRKQEQFLRTVFDGSEHAIFTLDVLEGGKLCYSGWNPATERGTGFSSADVIGRLPEDVFGEVAGKAVYQKYLSCLEAGVPVTYEEYLPFQGKEIWWLTTLNPLKDSGGKIYRLVGTTIQITDRKLVEIQVQQQTKDLETALQELQQTQMQLVQSEKMSSLGQLVAGIAHEINNPVNFIYGNLAHANDYTQDLLELVQLYQQYYPDPILAIQELAEEIDLTFLIQDLPQLLNSMKIGAQRIREIVISLRTFSRMDEAEMKEVDIHDGIDSTLMILEHRIKAKPDHKSIKVIKEYSSLPLVECYAGQLNQVFMNILANAIDALEESMSNRNIPENPQIHIHTQLLDPNQVTISIADNGPGISEDVQQRLFDPFFTTKPIGKGTGMGLSISYQIISQKHGGSLKCISNLGIGGGTKFVITIPLRQN
ncbi:PAS domain S-box protein [Calothrix sp. PCC 7507]|uniref:PAS domain S-box protein n=1 Tax=Calothrix sp. PCC 7507 TaxID=99598 RepID=UPI00135F1AE3|nr:PAS domain S-box protein [Calothrix sp. PCC 7507]